MRNVVWGTAAGAGAFTIGELTGRLAPFVGRKLCVSVGDFADAGRAGCGFVTDSAWRSKACVTKTGSFAVSSGESTAELSEAVISVSKFTTGGSITNDELTLIIEACEVISASAVALAATGDVTGVGILADTTGYW